jgi:hypothetical protein
MVMNQEQSADNVIDSLGDIFGVSELTVKENSDSQAACSVVVAENALVFLAWEFDGLFTGKQVKTRSA